MKNLFNALLAISLALIAFGCDLERQHLRYQDQDRSYLLHIPNPRPTADAPLVIALHGRLGTGAGQKRSTGFNELADRDGVVVIYPDGLNRSWADARQVSPSSQQGVDDEGFILQLIAEVEKMIPIDRNRVSIMGVSNGGFMTQTMACLHAEEFSAAASAISTIPQTIFEDCQPAQPLSVLFMNGTDDPLVPFSGGQVNSDAGGEISSSDNAAKYWVEVDRCSPGYLLETLDEVEDDTIVHVHRYQNCASGTQVHYYTVEGGGHTWPGGPQYLSEDTVGRVSQELNGMQVIWDFLVQQRRSEDVN